MTTSLPAEPHPEIADMFTSAVLAAAISAAWELGLVDELAERGRVEVEAFAAEHRLDPRVVSGLLDGLSAGDLVVPEPDGAFLPGRLFDEVLPTLGFFYWLTRGCGELFTTLPSLAADRSALRRDLRAVAVATRHIGTHWVDQAAHEILDGLPAGVVADLGCGGADRLLSLLRHRPDARGVGIDVSPAALDLARSTVEQAGMADRVTLLLDDASRLRPAPELEEVELVTCFFMGHDLWPRDECIASLRRLRTALPHVTDFVLADTARSDPRTGGTRPGIFTLGFELGHAVMGRYLPTLDEWDGVFAAGGWECRRRTRLDTPANTAIFHLVPA